MDSMKILFSTHIRKRIRQGCGICLAMVLSWACANPFSTRSPEPPDRTTSTFVNPSSPEIVFINLANSIQERNIENYVRSFVDSARSVRRFVFVADQGVASTRPGTFLDWGLESERTYLGHMFQATPRDSLISVKFSEQNRNDTSTTSEVTQNYTLIIAHSQNSQGLGRVIRGQASFLLERDESGDWAIYRWEDFKLDSNEQSWSDLKAFFL